MNIIPDGRGGFVTLTEIVAIVNSSQNYDIKAEDLKNLIATEPVNTIGYLQEISTAERVDYWRGKYDALKEIIDGVGDKK